MNKHWLIVPLALALSAAGAQDMPEMSKEEIAAQLNGVNPADITDSPLPGIYQVTLGSNVAYVSQDGRYLMQGDLYDLSTSRNLTEQTRADKRVDMLTAVDPESMIVFSPEDGNVRHSITIFTDIDCGYCRQFHREIEQVNALGIEVHYLAYPRTGPGSESWTKAVNVWCDANRSNALTQAKLGGRVPDSSCNSAPVGAHYELGNAVGVRGTPAVYSAGGEHIGGYLPPAQLATVLEELAAD